MRLRTRAEIDAEPRTAQFEFVSVCPHIAKVYPPANGYTIVPVAVTVSLDAFTHPICGGKGWRMTQRDGVTADGHFRPVRTWGDDPSLPAICEHMGRIIE